MIHLYTIYIYMYEIMCTSEYDTSIHHTYIYMYEIMICMCIPNEVDVASQKFFPVAVAAVCYNNTQRGQAAATLYSMYVYHTYPCVHLSTSEGTEKRHMVSCTGLFPRHACAYILRCRPERGELYRLERERGSRRFRRLHCYKLIWYNVAAAAVK